MLAQILQIFLGKEHLVKNWPSLDEAIYFKGTNIRGLRNLSSLHKIGWKKFIPIKKFFF
jgi:hypothetical protein